MSLDEDHSSHYQRYLGEENSPGHLPSADPLKNPPPVLVTGDTDTMTSIGAGVVGRGRSPMVNAIHLGLSFCFIFLAFNVAQYSQTSLSPSVGATGLAILYGVFTLSNTVSSHVVSLLGLRMSLFLGALTYAAYVAANIETLSVVLYIVSAVIGVGAAILWTAQGGFIAECSLAHETVNGLPKNSTMGLFNGIFFSIFQVNQFAGNLLAALLYQYNVSQSTVFSIMTGLCGLGVSSLLFLPRQLTVDKHRDIDDEIELIVDEDADSASVSGNEPGFIAGMKRALVSLTLLKDRRMLLLVMIIIYSGCEQSFMYGVFPPMIASPNHKFYVLAFLGGMDAFASFLMGKLSDKIGRVPILVIGTLAHAAVYLYFLIWSPTMLYGKPMDLAIVWYFVLALGLAVGDGVFNTQVYAILGTYFRDRPAQAFANFKLFQSMSTAALFGFTASTPPPSVWSCAMITFCALIAGMVLIVLCHLFSPFGHTHAVPADKEEQSVQRASQKRGGKRNVVV